MTMQDLDWPAEPGLEINAEACNQIIESIRNVLVEKNKRYGNSALAPINVFYKGNATDSICIRLDDKLSRIKNSSELRKNDLFDLLGYCLLYLVGINKNEDETFEQKVDSILELLKLNYTNYLYHEKMYLGCITFEYDGFLKGERGDNVIDSLNGVCSDIKKHKNIPVNLVIRLSYFLIVYFIQNGITDFSDLID